MIKDIKITFETCERKLHEINSNGHVYPLKAPVYREATGGQKLKTPLNIFIDAIFKMSLTIIQLSQLAL